VRRSVLVDGAVAPEELLAVHESGVGGVFPLCCLEFCRTKTVRHFLKCVALCLAQRKRVIIRCISAAKEGSPEGYK